MISRGLGRMPPGGGPFPPPGGGGGGGGYTPENFWGSPGAYGVPPVPTHSGDAHPHIGYVRMLTSHPLGDILVL